MNIYERNIRVFFDNRKLSTYELRDETLRMKNLTKVYKTPLECSVSDEVGEMKVVFLKQDTISSVLGVQDKKVCALNFADAYNPGGLVFKGELTQEEDLCRCSNLYESLVNDECMDEYYDYNTSLNRDIFSDRIIYSKDVLVYRSSPDYKFIDNPVRCDIITCPAPLAFSIESEEEYYKIILNRIRGMIRVIAHNEVKTIILGAWGCGAFGGNAYLVGRAFAEVLSEIRYFDTVYFSVRDSKNVDNFSRLKEGYESFIS